MSNQLNHIILSLSFLIEDYLTFSIHQFFWAFQGPLHRSLILYQAESTGENNIRAVKGKLRTGNPGTQCWGTSGEWSETNNLVAKFLRPHFTPEIWGFSNHFKPLAHINIFSEGGCPCEQIIKSE